MVFVPGVFFVRPFKLKSTRIFNFNVLIFVFDKT